MASYEYPADQQYGTVIIGGGISATPIEQAAIVITAPNKCEGYAEGGNFCGLRTPYKVYFVAEFDTDALESGTWKRNELKPNTTFAEGEYTRESESGEYRMGFPADSESGRIQMESLFG